MTASVFSSLSKEGNAGSVAPPELEDKPVLLLLIGHVDWPLQGTEELNPESREELIAEAAQIKNLLVAGHPVFPPPFERRGGGAGLVFLVGAAGAPSRGRVASRRLLLARPTLALAGVII